jgi:hypothetical protein
MDPMVKEQVDPLMVAFNQPQTATFSMKYIVVLLIVILAGIGTGYGLSQRSGGASMLPGISGNNAASSGKIVGSDDLKTYKDSTEGVLREGGIEGEGQFHLERPGGESQNVYMTSSTVDLALFVGKKIKVWGQTQTAQRAGWLMDVGRVQVL